MDDGSLELVGPSDVTVDRHPGNHKPRALTVDEIEWIVEAYGEGTRRARAVELNAIAGTGFISHFLSAHTNKRTDGYGAKCKEENELGPIPGILTKHRTPNRLYPASAVAARKGSRINKNRPEVLNF